ncbi:GYDIA family GHMP kinase, partial [Algibacter sp.]|uniref:GYDIA family GHMP kinase n=1 Tax=Algibacter sp. TaxID=1872428 RepID=UPI003C73B865
IPTKYGQSLPVESINKKVLGWKSLDEKGNIWFGHEFELKNDDIIISADSDDTTKRLSQILNAAKTLNPNFLKTETGFKVTTSLTFPRKWGLGTSSTLINNVAQWAKINAFELLQLTFGGSGYDIACAQNNTPIIYQTLNNKITVNPIDFNPEFKDQLYFVYLNQKKNSREGISAYNSNKTNLNIPEINSIVMQIAESKTLAIFETLINKHETIISKITKQKPVKELLFSDFEGSIKSLGAWGGDFVLVVSQHPPNDYFNNKGYDTIIPYSDMIL